MLSELFGSCWHLATLSIRLFLRCCQKVFDNFSEFVSTLIQLLPVDFLSRYRCLCLFFLRLLTPSLSIVFFFAVTLQNHIPQYTHNYAEKWISIKTNVTFNVFGTYICLFVWYNSSFLKFTSTVSRFEFEPKSPFPPFLPILYRYVNYYIACFHEGRNLWQTSYHSRFLFHI